MSNTATVTVPLLASPLPAGSAAQAALAFTCTDSAGVALPVQDVVPAVGASSASAVFNVAAAAVGLATFGVVAMDANGVAIGIPVTGTAMLGVVAPPSYLAPQSPLSIVVA